MCIHIHLCIYKCAYMCVCVCVCVCVYTMYIYIASSLYRSSVLLFLFACLKRFFCSFLISKKKKRRTRPASETP